MEMREVIARQLAGFDDPGNSRQHFNLNKDKYLQRATYIIRGVTEHLKTHNFHKAAQCVMDKEFK